MKTNYLVILTLLGSALCLSASTLTVTNSADSGDGTLRQAILDANADASPDLVTIAFNIPGTGVQTIAPLTPLPTITRAVTIDGYTQPGASPNTLAQGDNAVLLIELNGVNLSGAADNGLYVQGSGSTVRGLVINRFAIATGLFVQDSDNNVIEGNFIGTDATGTNVLANNRGIAIYSSIGNRIGGLSPASRNIIGGSSESGISLAYVCTSNQVIGNYIGLGADGLTVVSNNYGIGVTDTDNQIGGSAPGARNIISGNYIGCSIGGGTMMQGNFIGTDASGTLPRGNHYGIHIPESRNNLIGGTATGEGNLISGNESGVVIQGDTATNNVVAGNLIGTDVSGMNALGNIIYGVLIYAPPGNLIGGTNAGARNVISGTTSVGVAILGPNASNNIVAGNFIGTDVTGTNALGNVTGIAISEAPGNRIGGLTPGSRNIVSGNQYGISLQAVGTEILGNYVGLGVDGVTVVSNTTGVFLHYSTQTQVGGLAPGAGNVISGNAGAFYANQGGSNIIQGNFIGTDASGTLPRGNLYGIALNESSHNRIGGTEAGAGNLVSGNSSSGVQINGVYASNNIIAGNLLGTDVTGTNALGNGDYGVFIGSAPDNVLGGTAPGAANVISGSFYAGIAIFYGGATGNVIQGNFVGTDFTGTLALSNQQSGILIGTPGNLIGGTTAGAGNVIAFSTYSGVGITVDTATNNAVLGNSIFAIGGSGIDLGGDGLTANDPGDADGSPNHFQNFPEITSATLIGGDLTVQYSVDSAGANSAYPLTVEFFLADSVASGEGRTIIHRHTYDTAQAFTNITFTPAATVSDGDPVVAVATDANGNTSEFSAAAIAAPNHQPVVANPISDQSGIYGSAFSYVFPANTFSDPDAGDTLSYAASGLPPGILFNGGTRSFNGTPTNTGTFTVTVTATDSGTPALSTNDLFDIVVAKASLIVTANNKNKLQGQPNPPLDGILAGVTNSDNIIATFTTTAVTGSPAGNYPITPLFGDPNNRLTHYIIITNEGTLAVTAPNTAPVVANPIPDTNSTYGAVLSFTLSANTFNDPDAGQILTYTASNLPPGITFTSTTRTFSGTNMSVGVYVVKVTATDNGAPPLSTNDTFSFVVGKALLTARALDQTNYYGTSIFLSPYFGVEYTGFVLGESAFGVGGIDTFSDIATTATETSPVGTYPITLSGGSDARYQFVLQNGTLIITNAPLLVVVNYASRVVGKTNPPLSGRFVGLKNNDPITLAFTTIATPASPVGDYPISAAIIDPNHRQTNYTVSYVQGALTVIPYDFVYGTVHSFWTTDEMGIVDDAFSPGAAVMEGHDGILYGIAHAGNDLNGPGAIFRVNKDATGYRVLTNLTAVLHYDTTPGPLVQGTNGMLYGTTSGGGSFNPGNIFKVNTNGSDYMVMHTFSEPEPTIPNGPLLLSTNGSLYGSAGNGPDTIYRIQQDGTGFTVIWQGCCYPGAVTNEPDNLVAGLIEGRDGALYGVSSGGGQFSTFGGGGTVFKVQKDGSDMTVLHSLSDGPRASLIQDSDGVLYGVGASDGLFANGTVFSLNEDGSDFKVLHHFDVAGGDGGFPVGSLLEGRDGALYGTTRDGGNGGPYIFGTAFRLNKDGTGYCLLHNFGYGPTNSGYLTSALIQGNDGIFYGTAQSGGLLNVGAVFRLFELVPPTLHITSAGSGTTTVSWQPPTPGFMLQTNASLASFSWSNAPSGSTNPVTLPIKPAGQFFRLRSP